MYLLNSLVSKRQTFPFTRDQAMIHVHAPGITVKNCARTACRDGMATGHHTRTPSKTCQATQNTQYFNNKRLNTHIQDPIAKTKTQPVQVQTNGTEIEHNHKTNHNTTNAIRKRLRRRTTSPNTIQKQTKHDKLTQTIIPALDARYITFIQINSQQLKSGLAKTQSAENTKPFKITKRMRPKHSETNYATSITHCASITAHVNTLVPQNKNNSTTPSPTSTKQIMPWIGFNAHKHRTAHKWQSSTMRN